MESKESIQVNPEIDVKSDQPGPAGRHLPLPAEIIAMSEGETACRFCGVSYLLLSRMEALQREFATLENELEARKQYAEERPALLERVRRAEEQSLGLKASLEEQERVNQLLQDSVSQWKVKLDMSERQLERTSDELQAMSVRFSRSQTLLQKSSSAIRLLNQEINELKRETVTSVRILRTSVKESLVQMQCHVGVIVDAQVSDRVREATAKVSQEFESQNMALRSQVDDLVLQVAQSQHNIKQVTEAKNKAVAELHIERQHVADLESALTTSTSQRTNERESFQKTCDAWKTKEATLSDTIQSINRDLNAALDRCRNATLQLESERQLRVDSERALADARAAQTSSQASREKLIDELRVKHVAMEQRIRQMESERADTVAAHQNRLSQLQASFQEKLLAAQNQREQKCKQESAVLVGALEKELTATRSALTQLQDAEATATSQVRRVQEELEEMQKQLEDRREEIKRTSEKNHALDQEKRSAIAALDELKRRQEASEQQHIKELEQCKYRISQLELERHQVLRDVQSKQASQIQWVEAKRQLEEEIAALKETVRDECEERLKLVEQLEAFRSGASSVAGSSASLNRAAAGSPRADTPATQAASNLAKSPRANGEVAGGLEAFFESKLEKASAKKTRKIRALGRS